MKAQSRFLFCVAACMYLVDLSCQTAPSLHPEELETPLPKLTSAVQAEVRYPESPGAVSEEELMVRAVKDKPELQRAFHGVRIIPWHDDRNVVLLVCSPDGKYCWFEDASWTLGVDRRCYKSNPPVPAEFTLIETAIRLSQLQSRPALPSPE